MDDYEKEQRYLQKLLVDLESELEIEYEDDNESLPDEEDAFQQVKTYSDQSISEYD